MDQEKKLIATLFLKDGCAVRSMEDTTVLTPDPLWQAISLDHDGGEDALLIVDLQESESERERHLELIGQICARVNTVVWAAAVQGTPSYAVELMRAGCRAVAVPGHLFAATAARIGKEHTGLWLSDSPTALTPAMAFAGSEEAGERAQSRGCPVYVCQRKSTIPELLAREGVAGVWGAAVSDAASEYRQIREDCAQRGISLYRRQAAFPWSAFRKDEKGLLPVVVQEEGTGTVLMVAYMNEEAYNLTVQTGKMTYWSRSRQELWLKGDTSGHYQFVRSLYGDCDMDTLLAKVVQQGAACHTGSHSCFFNEDFVERRR